VTRLILDEADALLDPLFREQTLAVWRACTHRQLRVSLWSATMGSNIEEIVRDTAAARLRNSVEAAPAPLVRLVVGLKDAPLPTVRHTLTYCATEHGKLVALRQMLRPKASDAETGNTPNPNTNANGGDASLPRLTPPVLIFTQTAARAVALARELRYLIPAEAGGSSRIGVLHGGLGEGARAATAARFRAGQLWLLVATDVLARGVDFAGVNAVVSYDMATTPAAYVHRAGRTGRAARTGGTAVTLVAKEDLPFVRHVVNAVMGAVLHDANGKNRAEAGPGDWWTRDLPAPSQRDRKRLRWRGVEERRAGLEVQVEKGARAAAGKTGIGTELRRQGR
jgi:ATP-dependent RNA helicase DDX52/ROK1